MGDEIWEVVGGAGRGGILVREGKDLKSAELPERLSTGALVKQLALEDGRLNFKRCTGIGPRQGWVSLKLKEADLVVKSTKPLPKSPVLVCFYSGGCTASQGRRMLQPFVSKAKEAGLEDVVVMDHIEEKGFQDLEDWDDYVDRMAAKLELEAGPLSERYYFLMAHSHGCVPAWGLAKRLSSRCLKLYPVGRRPPSGGLLDDVWDVDRSTKLADLDDEFLLLRMLESWPNLDLQQVQDKDPMCDTVKKVLEVVRRQYSSPVYPAGSWDAPGICADPEVEAPILAVAASDEAPRGETEEKMRGWKSFTKRSCEVLTIDDTTHMGIIKSPQLQEVVVKNMVDVARLVGLAV